MKTPNKTEAVKPLLDMLEDLQPVTMKRCKYHIYVHILITIHSIPNTSLKQSFLYHHLEHLIIKSAVSAQCPFPAPHFLSSFSPPSPCVRVYFTCPGPLEESLYGKVGVGKVTRKLPPEVVPFQLPQLVPPYKVSSVPF